MSNPCRSRPRGASCAHTTGVLSTISQDVPGYPFGSITPYVLTHEGAPILLVSEIAQHTKHMRGDTRVSLTIVNDATDKQANARVTLVGDAREVAADELERLSARYYAFFPAHRRYFEAHNFLLYTIAPSRIRYIGGFGNIHWIEPEGWMQPTPEWRESEQGAIDYMNTDHREALPHMLAYQLHVEEAKPEVISIDRDGFHVRGADERLYYLTFLGACESSDDLHTQMVALAREARAALLGRPTAD